MELLKQMYEDLKKLLSSRTVVTILSMLAFNLVDAFSSGLPMSFSVAINVLLATLATYFRVNTKTKF